MGEPPNRDARALVFEGRCWVFGDNIPTDSILPTHLLLQGFEQARAHILEGVEPRFPREVQPGDLICAGRNFACSSGRAVAAKALKRLGIAAVVAESFARTFFRNGFEIGLPLVELRGICGLARPGDRLRVDVAGAVVENLTTHRHLAGRPPPAFLLDMLRAGGLIALVKSGRGVVPASGRGA